MTSNDQRIPDEQALDRQWDELVTGRSTVIDEPLLRDLHAARQPRGPSPLFRAQLRSLIETAVRDQMPAWQGPKEVERNSSEPVQIARPEPIQPVRRPRYARMRGLTGASKVASVLLAASLLVAMLASVIRYPFGGSNPTESPATGAQTAIPAASGSPEVATNGPSSADPGRTNQQPGPAPMGIPSLIGHADVSGSAMALGGNTIVIVGNDTVTALDAASLKQRWSVEVPWGAYTAPVIAGDAICFGFTGQREGQTELLVGADQPNQLVSLSLKDGSENWRIDGAGAYPVAPIVLNGTVYAVGSTPDAYRLGAYNVIDGRTLWTAEPFSSDPMPENSYPKVLPYIWMTLAYGDGLIAVNQMRALSVFDAGTGTGVWTRDAQKPDVVGRPFIEDHKIVATFGHSPMDNGVAGRGSIVALDLRSGSEMWSGDNLAGYSFGAAVRNGTAVFAQLTTANVHTLSALALQSGAQDWTTPSWDRAADPGPDYWPGGPDMLVVSGDLVFTAGQASDHGSQARTLVTARDIASGDVDWTAIIDSTAVTAPIIAGGKIFVLTDLYGLQVLGSSETSATPADGSTDLRSLNRCAATPMENPLLGTPEADGTPIPAWARWGEVMPLSEVPQVDPAEAVSPDVAAAIEDAIARYRACMVEGDPQLLFGFFSADYYQRIRDLNMGTMDGKDGESGTSAVMLAGSNERIDLDPATLQTWPDGRIGGIVHGNTDIYLWFVEEDGAWKIDEYHRIMDTSPIPEESPSPEQ